MEIGATKATSLQLQTSGASSVNVRGPKLLLMVWPQASNGILVQAT